MGSWGAVGTPAPGAAGGAHLRLGTGFEPELAQDVEQRQLELQEPQPHPEAAPGARPERQVRVGPLALLRLRREPAGQHGQGGPGTPLPYTGLHAPPTRQMGPQPSNPLRPAPHPPGSAGSFSAGPVSPQGSGAGGHPSTCFSPGSTPPVLPSPPGTVEFKESPGTSTLPSLPLLMNSLRG